jgi:UDP-N-acetylglucosamine 4,6-dehydratase/5-epimerase
MKNSILKKNFFFKNKSILITGGTGSLGQNLVLFLLKNKFPFKKIIIFSRDELKQFKMSEEFDVKKNLNLRFFLGDVRDKDRLKFALRDVNFVIHAAALKQVPIAEYNPFEFIQTNVLGAQNIIESSLDPLCLVENVIALSTDKASSPINLYGATKLCSDKLFVSANNIKGRKNIKFSVARYGNVMGSRGSVLHTFLEQNNTGSFKITDERMTRFNILIDDAVRMIIWTLTNNYGGEIFIPKLPSLKIIDLAKAINPKNKIKKIGLRPGEKIHEEMISAYDSINSVDMHKYYAILPDFLLKTYLKKNYKLVPKDFIYSSDKNNHFLKIEEIKKMIDQFRKNEIFIK